MEGHSVLAHIHGFLPFFYVPAQPGFKEDDCGKFKVRKLSASILAMSRENLSWVWTRSDTNRAVQPLNMARGLKFKEVD